MRGQEITLEIINEAKMQRIFLGTYLQGPSAQKFLQKMFAEP